MNHSKRFKALLLSGLLLGLLFFTLPVLAQEDVGVGAVPLTLDSGTVGIVIGLAALVVALLRNRDKGDSTLVAYFQQQQAQREQMAQLERAYQQTMFKSMFDLATMTARTVAPLTPFKADDALAKWMQDIQQPGAPPASDS